MLIEMLTLKSGGSGSEEPLIQLTLQNLMNIQSGPKVSHCGSDFSFYSTFYDFPFFECLGPGGCVMTPQTTRAALISAVN
jgi:hypothetical protein